MIDTTRLKADAELAYENELTDAQRALYRTKENFVERWIATWRVINVEHTPA